MPSTYSMIMKWRFSCCPWSMIWTMFGCRSRMPGLGLLVEADDGVRDVGEPPAQHLDGNRLAGVVVLAPVDPGEGSLGQMEEGPVVAEEEAGRVPLAEAVDLPARQQPLRVAACGAWPLPSRPRPRPVPRDTDRD